MVSIRQLIKELKEAQTEEAELNLQSEGQEGTHKVEEAQARLNKARKQRDILISPPHKYQYSSGADVQSIRRNLMN